MHVHVCVCMSTCVCMCMSVCTTYSNMGIKTACRSYPQWTLYRYDAMGGKIEH